MLRRRMTAGVVATAIAGALGMTALTLAHSAGAAEGVTVEPRLPVLGLDADAAAGKITVHNATGAALPKTRLTLEGAGHGFKGPDQEKAEQAMIAFFDAHLKKK